MLIVGCGSDYRGDDAAGLLVVRRLCALGVPAVEDSGEPLRLIERWAGYDCVWLIDAVVTGAPAGHISSWDASAVPLPSNAFPCSTHGWGVAEEIEFARSLGRLPQVLRVFGIEAEQFRLGAPVSAPVADAAEALASRIAEEYRCTANSKY